MGFSIEAKIEIVGWITKAEVLEHYFLLHVGLGNKRRNFKDYRLDFFLVIQNPNHLR